jgi:hypothetical protein
VTGVSEIIQPNKLTISLWRKEDGLRRAEIAPSGGR